MPAACACCVWRAVSPPMQSHTRCLRVTGCMLRRSLGRKSSATWTRRAASLGDSVPLSLSLSFSFSFSLSASHSPLIFLLLLISVVFALCSRAARQPERERRCIFVNGLYSGVVVVAIPSSSSSSSSSSDTRASPSLIFLSFALLSSSIEGANANIRSRG